MNVVTHDAAVARETRLRLWAEHLELTVDDVAGDPADVIDELWKPISEAQLARPSGRGAADAPPRAAARMSRAAQSGCSARCRGCSSTVERSR